MATLRYRPLDLEQCGDGPWRRWDDPAMSEDAFVDIWGAEFEIAIEDADHPNTLVLLSRLTPEQSQAHTPSRI